jgi:hypothetical protein
MKRVLMIARGVLAAVIAFGIGATPAEAGYWQLADTVGKKDRSDPPIVGTGWQNKYRITDNSLMFYSYTHEGLQKQLQFSWSVPDRLYPGRVAVMTAEGKAIRREPRWQGSNDLSIVFSGGFVRLGTPYVGAEAGYTEQPLKRVIEMNPPAGSTEGKDPTRFGYIHINMGHNTDKDSYTYVYEWRDGEGSGRPDASPPSGREGATAGTMHTTGASAGAPSVPISGTWLCNQDRVRRNEPGNQTIQIDQSGDRLVFTSPTGGRSEGRLSGDVLSSPGWTFGGRARLGINVDGRFVSQTDAKAKFRAADDTRWNFIRWDDGMTCVKDRDSSASAGQVSDNRAGTHTEVTHPGGQDQFIFNNFNPSGVQNGPRQPTVFSVRSPTMVTYINNYHYFNQGRPTGTIALRHEDGTTYGPWRSQGSDGQGAVANANWIVRPNVEIKPGRYTVVDSDPPTWSQNGASGGAGFSQVKGYVTGYASGAARTAPPSSGGRDYTDQPRAETPRNYAPSGTRK